MWKRCFTILTLGGLLLYACGPVSEPVLEEAGEAGLADSLFNMADKLVGTDAELAVLYLNRALANAGSGGEALARYHMIYGRINYYTDDYDLSVAHLDTALACMNGDADPDSPAEANRPAEAISLADVNRLADCNFYKASSLRLMGNYPAALVHNLEAIKLYRQSGNVSFLSRSYNFHASVYLEQDDLEKAMAYVKLADAESATLPQSLSYANVLSTRANILKAMGEPDSAGQYMRKAYLIRLRCANIRHMASSLVELAELAWLQEQYDSARTCLRDAEEIYLELEEKTGLFNVYYTLTKLDYAEGDYDRALALGQKAEEMARRLKYPALNENICQLLSELHKVTGDYQSALEYHEKSFVHHKELMTVRKQKLIAGIEYANALENQQRDNEFLVQRNRVRQQQVIVQTLIIVLLLVVLSAVLVSVYLYRKNSRSRQELLEKENLLLGNDLKVRNKELTGKSLELLHTTETLQSLAGRMEKLQDGDPRREIESILQELKIKNREHAWDEFHTAFNHVHRDFYDKLFEVCPELSATEIKMAALLKLNLSTKEIAAISYKSESAVKTTRHRLRSKLNLKQGEKLIPFLMKL